MSLEDFVVQTQAHIEKFGISAVHVPAGDGDDEPPFAFSIGLFHRLQHPEILIAGWFDQRTQHILLNLAAKLVLEGRALSDGDTADTVLQDLPVTFRRVAKERVPEWLGSACGFYGHDHFGALQCVLPDAEGRFPWDEGVTVEELGGQPALWEPV